MQDKIQYNFFMKVPNDRYGWDIIARMKKFLNKNSYRIRLRGTGLDRTKAPEGYKRFRDHVPLCYAKEVRIYIHAKVPPTWSQKDQVIGIDTLKRLMTKPFSKRAEPYEYESSDVVGTPSRLRNNQ